MSIYSSRIVIQNNDKPTIKELEDEKEVKDYIDDFEQDTGIEIIDKEDNLDDLEDEHDEWHQMTYHQRKQSDAKSVELFGKTNKERYDNNKSDLLQLQEFEGITSNSDTSVNHTKADFNASKTSQALEYIIASDIKLIYPKFSLEDLELLWNDWNQMTYNQRLKSNNKSLEIFGMTNKDHYDKMKANLLKHKSEDDSVKNVDDNTITSDIVIEESDVYSLANMYLEMKSNGNIYEDMLIKKAKHKILNKIEVEDDYTISLVNDLPYFQPEDMKSMGIFGTPTSNFYGVVADNHKLNENTRTNQWFESYEMIYSGIIPENYDLIIKDWMKLLNELYSDINQLNGDKLKARKQSILELGWNPEIPFNARNRKLSTDKIKKNIKLKNEIYDISNIQFESSSMTNNTEIYPVYIILTFTNTPFGNLIKKYTHSIYSHASISLDTSLEKMYSYVANLKGGGFAVENINNFNHSKHSRMCVYTLFVNKSKYVKIKDILEYYINNKNSTKYSVSNIMGIVLNKPVVTDNNMICSQFVDSLLKDININITNKDSSLVTPHDIYMNLNNKLYKVYEGLISKYNAKEILHKIENFSNNSFIYNESVEYSNEDKYILEKYIIPHEVISEVKEFPVQFDKEGNLLIANMSNLDFEEEFSKSHKLLIRYHESNNLEGIKYELAKLWFLNILLEKKIYNSKDTDKQKYHKARARVLNDFNKYLKVTNGLDNEFNFTEYYEETPFSNSKYKINNSTLKYSRDIAKDIIKVLL